MKSRIEGKYSVGVCAGRKPLLNAGEETKLADFAANRAAMGYGFGKRQFLNYAGALANKYGRKFKKGVPSHQWWYLYKRRNHNRLSLRQPEGTSSIRHRCMEPAKVAGYFVALEGELSSNELMMSPSRIWNMDETGLSMDHKPRKVVAATGSRHLQSCTSGNREMLTVIATISADGKCLPPHVIAKGKTLKSLASFQQEHAPAGTTWSVPDTGWTKQGIASLWFRENFLANIGDDRPQMLILDGHDSHNFVELIELAIENHIILVELPAHTSHWLQPCDRTVFGPFKAHYNSACQDMVNAYAGTIVSRHSFCTLLNTAWTKAMTQDNIKSGFRACGIYPFNPAAIPDEAYMPNAVYTVTHLMANRELLNTTADEQLPVEQEVIVAETQAVSNMHIDEQVHDLTNMHTDEQVFDLNDYLSNDSTVVAAIMHAIPPENALNLLLSNISKEQLQGYCYCYDNKIPLPDAIFKLWKCLKDLVQQDGIFQDQMTQIVQNGMLPDLVLDDVDLGLLLSGR